MPEKKAKIEKVEKKLTAVVFDANGKEKGEVALPENLFGLPWNGDLVHQVTISMMSNARQPLADTKDRSEVRGGGKKPWRQKGTGRARHGSRRSPIWIGGGVTHGPLSEKNFSRKVNKKMKIKALFTILSRKAREGEIVFVEQPKFDAPKTKTARAFLDTFAGIKGLEKINYKTGRRALLGLPEQNSDFVKSFNNLKGAETILVSNVNPLDLLTYKYFVMFEPEKSMDVLLKRAVS